MFLNFTRRLWNAKCTNVKTKIRYFIFEDIDSNDSNSNVAIFGCYRCRTRIKNFLSYFFFNFGTPCTVHSMHMQAMGMHPLIKYVVKGEYRVRMGPLIPVFHIFPVITPAKRRSGHRARTLIYYDYYFFTYTYVNWLEKYNFLGSFLIYLSIYSLLSLFIVITTFITIIIIIF